MVKISRLKETMFFVKNIRTKIRENIQLSAFDKQFLPFHFDRRSIYDYASQYNSTLVLSVKKNLNSEFSPKSGKEMI